MWPCVDPALGPFSWGKGCLSVPVASPFNVSTYIFNGIAAFGTVILQLLTSVDFPSRVHHTNSGQRALPANMVRGGQVPVASPATLRQRISRLPAGYPRRAIVPQPRAHLISQARIFPTRTQKPDCRELMTRAQTTGPGRLPAHGQCASSLAGARAASQSSDLWSASEDEWPSR